MRLKTRLTIIMIGMILAVGAQGLKGAPQPVAHMKTGDDHGQNVENDIQRIRKSLGNDIKDAQVGLIHKMKIEKVKNHKKQEKKTGVRHGCGSDGSASRRFVNAITVGSGPQVFIKQGRTGQDMDQG